MSKLVRIISLIMIMFIMASLVIYRLHLTRTMLPPGRGRTGQVERPDLKTAEGEIISVDTGNKTFIVDEADQNLVFTYDDNTKVSEYGFTAQPSGITPGTSAIVRYTNVGGKNRAVSISFVPRQPDQMN